MNTTTQANALAALSHYLQPGDWDSRLLLQFSELSGAFPDLRSAEWQRFISTQRIDWQPALLLATREHLAPSSLKNFTQLARHTQTYFADYSSGPELMKAPVGNLTVAHHMFHAVPAKWGFELTEAQTIKGLQHFLSQSPPVCQSFVSSLFRVAIGINGPSGTVPQRFTTIAAIDFANSFTVSAAQSAGRWGQPKRNELLIRWSARIDGKLSRFLVVLNCCFGTEPRKGQLTAYRPAATEPVDDYYCFLLSPRQLSTGKSFLPRSNAHQYWHQVRWRALLSAWERQLTRGADPGMEDFSRFRRTLWACATIT